MPENVEKVRRRPSLPSRSPLKPASGAQAAEAATPRQVAAEPCSRTPLYPSLCPNGRALRDAASNTYGLVGRAFLNIPQLLCV